MCHPIAYRLLLIKAHAFYGYPKGLAMMDTSLLDSITKQLLSGEEDEVEGKRLSVRRTSNQGLRTLTFTTGKHQYAAIEQHPENPNRRGQLARSGHQVVQFKE